MSRIRTVKPEFWSSEQIMDLTFPARLAFIGMWSFCDDGGVHPASFRTLKAEVFPGDDIDVSSLIDELLHGRLIVAYSVNGKSYWRVTGWRHQKIDKPNFKHPWPCGTVPVDNQDYRRLANNNNPNEDFPSDDPLFA